MTVPQTTEVPPVPYPHIIEGNIINQTPQPNWIQEAEAIAKADINRLEGKLGHVSDLFTRVGLTAILAFVVAVVALYRTFR